MRALPADLRHRAGLDQLRPRGLGIRYEHTYTIGGTVAGRISCRQHTSSSSGSLYHVIEWTSDELLIIGYVSNWADLRSWQDLIDFWANKAGPIAP